MNFKRLFAAIAFVTILSGSFASPVFNAPAVRIQPNGDTLHCLLSGDEFYHRLHDAGGYTIVQNPRTGYWVYADTVQIDANHWHLVATNYVAGITDPSVVGLVPNIVVDRDTWLKLQHRFDVPVEKNGSATKTSGTNHGVLNNIVIFVRFSDDNEISTSLSTIDAMFNDSSANATSMYNYFKTVSYGKMFIPTSYFPASNGNSVVSYQDSLPRAYYLPYDSTTNTLGYVDDDDRRVREFGLLERAVNYVNANSPVPTTLDIDNDNDGYVDNVCFVVKGTYTGWSDLLWPHKWSLYDRNVYINGKRVYTFNFQLEGSGSHYFSSSTFCHEMFHTLGAPDLYRYYNNTDVSGVGSWDLMCSNTTPPQHMSAYMKWKYGNWIDSIPEITIPGTYTLHSLGDSTYDNCAYKIAAQEPHQWYVLEYRDNTEMFEVGLPGRGLIIFRIDDRFDGNAGYDGVSTFDEVYLFRPGGFNDTVNGNTAQAFFSGNTSRTTFSPYTNPYPWLTDNVIDTTISISNVTSPGNTISFTYNDLRGCRIPNNLRVTAIMGHSANLHWSGNATEYTLEWRVGADGAVQSTVVLGTGYQLGNLDLDTEYRWRVRAVCSVGDITDYTEWYTFHTAVCSTPETSIVGTADTTLYYLPLNTYYNYSYTQMLYDSADMGGEMYISKIGFNYAYEYGTETKDNCVIYMGNTTKTSFTGTSMSNFVPFAQLQKVYEGPLNCELGWNDIVLDSLFHYDGMGSLVVAIDDNSGDYDGSYFKFHCTNTGNVYKSLTYYADNNNIDPAASTNSGNKSRRKQRAQIRFEGCPAAPLYQVTATVAVGGTVTGTGYYHEGDTATIEAVPDTAYSFLYWICGGDTVFDNPYTFTVTGNVNLEACFHLDSYMVTAVSANDAMGYVEGGGLWPVGSMATVTAVPNEYYSFLYWIIDGDTIQENPYTFAVTGDVDIVAYFHSDYYSVTAEANHEEMGQVTGGGMWPEGSTATLTAVPNPHYHFLYWTSDGDTITNNPYSYVVTANRSFTACFAIDRHRISVSSSDTSLGYAWIEYDDSQQQHAAAELDYGSTVWLYAQSRVVTDSYVWFEGWSDGEEADIRSITLESDTSLTANFNSSPLSVDDVDAIRVSTRGLMVSIDGAEGRKVMLHDSQGRCLYNLVGAATNHLTVQAAGVYLLSIEGLPLRKVVLVR